MPSAEVVSWMQKGMWLLMLTAAPAVLVATVIGLAVAVIQAATQLQDQTISQSLKLGAVLLTLAIAGPWMGSQIYRFADELLTALPGLGR
jgi:type III secretion HrpO family protein